MQAQVHTKCTHRTHSYTHTHTPTARKRDVSRDCSLRVPWAPGQLWNRGELQREKALRRSKHPVMTCLPSKSPQTPVRTSRNFVLSDFSDPDYWHNSEQRNKARAANTPSKQDAKKREVLGDKTAAGLGDRSLPIYTSDHFRSHFSLFPLMTQALQSSSMHHTPTHLKSDTFWNNTTVRRCAY